MRVIPVVLALLFIPLVSGLYADLSFDVRSDGSILVEGVTNVPSLEPGTYNDFTGKTGSRWLMNVTSGEVVESFVYTVLLPPGAQISYVSGRGARITTENGRVAVRGSGSDGIMTIVVQYTIEPVSESKKFAWLPLVGMTVLLVALWFVVRAKRTAKSAQRKSSRTDTPAYLDGIPERQQAMVKLLRKAGGTLTQRQLELALKLPKSSVSRNVEGLRRRGIIEKAQLGMTNTVVLSERYR